MYCRSTLSIIKELASKESKLIGSTRIPYTRTPATNAIMVPAPSNNALDIIRPELTALQKIEKRLAANVKLAGAVSQEVNGNKPAVGYLVLQWLNKLHQDYARLFELMEREKAKQEKSAKATPQIDELADASDVLDDSVKEVIPYNMRSRRP